MTSPTRFWLTSGVGESDFSELEAIDAAFLDSGIGYQNHVVVSSVPPSVEIIPRIDKKNGLTYLEVDGVWKLLPFSSIVFTVRSLNVGIKDESLTSSIALVKMSKEIDDLVQYCMLAYEAIGNNLEQTKSEALKGVRNLAMNRKAKIDETWGVLGFKTISSSLEVKKEYGCSASFVVFDPFTFTKIK